ncbi:MAG TPA: hypothetical protein VG164_14325, partial [Trebonia sp.]|nr:hypothetical protein [Trebonia sp.]
MSEDSARATLTRPVEPPPQRPRTAPRPRAARPPAVTDAVLRAPQAPPRTGPGPACPVPAPAPRTAPAAARRTASRVAPGTSNRMPFFILLCGLLSGALVSALVISTTLAEGSFEISKLQTSDSALARQRQQLQAEVAAAQSAQVIEQRAYQLGMRPLGELTFLNLKTGHAQQA